MEQSREQRFNFLCSRSKCSSLKQRSSTSFRTAKTKSWRIEIESGGPGMKHSPAGAAPGYGTPPIGVL
jgi:hypothetical protein